jgi:hypothetical protein
MLKQKKLISLYKHKLTLKIYNYQKIYIKSSFVDFYPTLRIRRA